MGNVCLRKRAPISISRDDNDSDSTTIAKRRWRQGNLAVTIAVTQSLSGDRVVYPTLAAGAKMLELRQLIKQTWKMPLASQRFVIGSEIISGLDSEEVAVVFHNYLAGTSETQPLEISCVRCGLEAEDQEAINNLLLQATALGDVERMKEALSEGADPNYGLQGCDSDRRRYPPPPLLFALAAGDADAIQVLREANVVTPEVEQRAPSFNIAFRLQDMCGIVEFLRQRADPNIPLRRGEGVKDTDSGTPLHAMCAMHQVPGAAAVVQLLLRLRADPDAKDGEGDSPLAHARYFGAKEIQDVLQNHGAKLEGPYYSTVHKAGRAIFGWR